MTDQKKEMLREMHIDFLRAIQDHLKDSGNKKAKEEGEFLAELIREKEQKK